MKQILIGVIILLVVADFLFWGGPSQLADHLQDAFHGGPAVGTIRAAGSIGGMIGNTNQGVGNAFQSGGGR